MPNRCAHCGLFGAAAALRDAIGAPRSSAEQATLDQNLQSATVALSAAEREAALRQGRETPVDDMLDDAGSYCAVQTS